MPATQAQLHEARKKLTDNGVSIVAIGEILLHLDYFGIKPEYTKIDLEIALINEIINAWNGKGYNKGNIEKLINSNAHEIDNILKRVKDIKDNGTAATGISVITANAYFKNTRGSEFIRVWEKQAQATEAELEITKTAKAAAEASLKEYKEKLGSETPEQLKAELDSLKKRPDITPEDFQKLKDNQFKHPDDQLEKPKPEDSKISDQKKGPFLTYLHTRPVFSKLYKEIKKLGSVFNVDLLHVTDDKNEFLKNLSEYRFNLLLWESKDGSWSVLWTQYRDKFDYYTDTDVELEVDQEEAQIKKFFKGESFENQFFHWGIDNSAEGKTKQGFATVAIETILKRIKDNPKLAMSEKLKENDLKLPEDSADIAQKEYDVYLEQLNQKDQKISQIEVGPLNK